MNRRDAGATLMRRAFDAVGPVASPEQVALSGRLTALGQTTGVLALFLVLGRIGLVTEWGAPVYPALLLGGAALATLANDWYRGDQAFHLHLRAAVNVAVAASIMYASGWGPMLIVGFMFICNDAVKLSGARAAWPAFGWSVVAIAAGQWLVHANAIPAELEPPSIHGLAVLGLAGLAFGVNALKRSVANEEAARAHLLHQAHHDTLTDLWNRSAFLERLEMSLASACQSHPVSVLFLDLDDFKTVNDSLGHVEGDRLLVQVAARLAGCLRRDDRLARLGGDEFAVLMRHRADEIPFQLAMRMLEALEAPFDLTNDQIFVRASIGIVTRRSAARGAGASEQALRDADVALYAAKARGKSQAAVFDPALQAAAVDRLALTADLRRAIDGNEFVIHYQPTVDLETGIVVGVEALVRWMRPGQGMVEPLEFIPIAEETGLVVRLGRWVLREACREVQQWQAQHPGRLLAVNVNLSPRQLAAPGLLDDVNGALADSGLSPEQLVLEITEGCFLDDMEGSIARLEEIRALGIKVAVDDFGTGYSSLSYLRELPIDVLKIDKSFVGAIGDTDGAALLDAILILGRTMHLELVAEGIEQAAHLVHVKQSTCDYGQGYYFARPGPLDVVVGDRERAILAKVVRSAWTGTSHAVAPA